MNPQPTRTPKAIVTKPDVHDYVVDTFDKEQNGRNSLRSFSNHIRKFPALAHSWVLEEWLAG